MQTGPQALSCMHVYISEWDHSTEVMLCEGTADKQHEFIIFLSLLLGNLKEHKQLLLIQMGWISLILVQEHECGWRKLGRGVRWQGGAGEVLRVGDEAWKEMKPCGGRTREWELNAKRIGMNDDKIYSFFSPHLFCPHCRNSMGIASRPKLCSSQTFHIQITRKC